MGNQVNHTKPVNSKYIKRVQSAGNRTWRVKTVFGFPIGLESGAKFFNQSLSVVMRNQSKCDLLLTLERNACYSIRLRNVLLIHDKSSNRCQRTDTCWLTSSETVNGATSWFGHLEKFSLNFSSSSFVIRVNLLHP